MTEEEINDESTEIYTKTGTTTQQQQYQNNNEGPLTGVE